MQAYRIYTEDVNRESVVKILDSLFDGYTLIPSKGVWHSKAEDSLVIEVLNTARENVDRAAQEIKVLNHQDAVMVTQSDTNVNFV